MPNQNYKYLSMFYNEKKLLQTPHHLTLLDSDEDKHQEDIELGRTEAGQSKKDANKRLLTEQPKETKNITTVQTITDEHFLSLHVSKLMQIAIGTLATILLYLSLSISLTFYQQSMLTNIKFPFTIVSYHLVVKFLLSATIRFVCKIRYGKPGTQLDWYTSLQKMAPTGIASGIDIGFSNWGLEFVQISLYTMTKSSTIIFILLFAILLGLEKKSMSLVLIVGLIALGLSMFTYKAAKFDTVGFTFILVASLSSGIRWSFAQFVMQKSKLGLHNPIDMIYHMQPWMVASLFPFLVIFEGKKLYDAANYVTEANTNEVLWIVLRITFGAIIAFFMEISEFLVLLRTSSLTLSISGIFKDICQVVLAVKVKGEQLSLINVFGLIVCLVGICYHVVHKYYTFTKLDVLTGYSNDVQLDDTTVTTARNKNHSFFSASKALSFVNKHSVQSVPLLEETDSDDCNDTNENGADVIFDVIKRRDMR